MVVLKRVTRPPNEIHSRRNLVGPFFCTSVFIKYVASLLRMVLLLSLILLSSCISTPDRSSTTTRGVVPADSIPGDIPAAESPEPSPPISAGPDQPELPWSLPEPERPVSDEVEIAIDRLLAFLSVEEKAAQLCMPGLGRDGPKTVEDLRPGGVILFREDLRTAEQVRALIEELQARSDIPLLVAIDHEGGVVDRLAQVPAVGATPMPSAAVVGRTGDASLAYELGRTMARELRSLGITVNLAPVADLRSNPANRVIGSRSYGSDPALVAYMVAATVRGLQDGGVSATLKHFPGHGDSSGDSHYGPVSLPHDLERLRAVELAPFAAGIAAGSDLVLTAHIAFPSITGSDEPATFSRILLVDVLRKEFAFQGVVMTDSLVMHAITDLVSPDEAAVRAIDAGADLLLQPADPRAARDGIVRAVHEGYISLERLDLSVRRILRIKFRRGLLAAADPGATVLEDTQGNTRLDGIVIRPERFTVPEENLADERSRALVERAHREGGS